MALAGDFLESHRRHWRDAKHLFEQQRWGNADHLYGLSAECGLKAVMQTMGMSVDEESGKPGDRKHRVHIDGLWGRFEQFAHGRAHAARLRIVHMRRNPFSDWSIHNRYSATGFSDKKSLEEHRMGALLVWCTSNPFTILHGVRPDP